MSALMLGHNRPEQDLGSSCCCFLSCSLVGVWYTNQCPRLPITRSTFNRVWDSALVQQRMRSQDHLPPTGTQSHPGCPRVLHEVTISVTTQRTEA